MTASNALSYPARNVAFRYYPVGWWVVHRETDMVGRVLSRTPTASFHGGGTKYRVFFPATATALTCQGHALRSATRLQSRAINLHPLAHHVPE